MIRRPVPYLLTSIEGLVQYLAGRAPMIMAALALIGLGVLVLVASRVAAHLSRQLSRPLNELVGWAGLMRPRHGPPGGRPGAQGEAALTPTDPGS